MRFYTTKIVRVALSLVVAFWMAGAGCLLGCENMVANAAVHAPAQANTLTIVASGDACATKRSHDCCASRKKAPQTSSAEQTTEQISALRLIGVGESRTSMRDCPL